MKKTLALTAALSLLATAVMAATVTYDFETDQSTSFTEVEYNGPDSSSDYQFDYSTLGIASAPNGVGTTGLAFQANLSAGAANSLTAYPDVSALNPADGDWMMTFDLIANYGDNSGSTTEFLGFGAMNTNTTIGVGTDGENGFSYLITVDGGSGTDYRYGDGASTPLDYLPAAPNWWGTGVVNNLDQEWQDYFTTTNGVPGTEWTTIRLLVTNGGADREILMQKAGDASFVSVSTITGGAGTGLNPFVGLADYFTSIQTGAQYAIFDNIVIDDDPVNPVASIDDWSMY